MGNIELLNHVKNCKDKIRKETYELHDFIFDMTPAGWAFLPKEDKMSFDEKFGIVSYFLKNYFDSIDDLVEEKFFKSKNDKGMVLLADFLERELQCMNIDDEIKSVVKKHSLKISQKILEFLNSKT